MKRALIPVAALALAAIVSGCSTVDRTVSAAQHGDWKCVGGTVAGLAVGGIAGHGIGKLGFQRRRRHVLGLGGQRAAA